MAQADPPPTSGGAGGSDPGGRRRGQIRPRRAAARADPSPAMGDPSPAGGGTGGSGPGEGGSVPGGRRRPPLPPRPRRAKDPGGADGSGGGRVFPSLRGGLLPSLRGPGVRLRVRWRPARLGGGRHGQGGARGGVRQRLLRGRPRLRRPRRQRRPQRWRCQLHGARGRCDGRVSTSSGAP